MNYAGWRLKTLDKFRNPGLPSSRPFRNSLDCSFSPQKLFLTSLSWTVSTRRRRRTSATGAPFARSVVAEKWGCGLEVGFLENEIPETPLSTWLHNALIRPISARYRGGLSLRVSERILLRRLERRSRRCRGEPSGRDRRNISIAC